MLLPKYVFPMVAALLLEACAVISVQSYTAADGSSRGVYANSCVSPYPLSSTVILDRPDVRVRLNVLGIAQPSGQRTFANSDPDTKRAAILHLAVVLEPQPGIAARLLDTSVVVDSPDFAKPLVARYGSSLDLFIGMPAIPSEISISFPKLEVQGQSVELTRLVLRRERRTQVINLVCQA